MRSLPYLKSSDKNHTMIVDSTNCFRRNPEILQDVCTHRVEIANFVLNLLNPEENYDDVMYYQSEIRHYKLYDV